MTDRKRATVATPRRDPTTGKWGWVVDIPAPDGKRKQIRRRNYRTKEEAKAALDELRTQARTSSLVLPDRILFGEYLKAWLAGLPATGKKATTLESYQRHLRLHVLSKPLAGVRLQQLTALHLDQLYSDLRAEGRVDGEGGLSGRTVQFVHGIISKALNDALRKRLVAVNVASAASAPSRSSTKPPEPKIWTLEELQRFLEAPAVRSDRLYPMWRLAALTGMRRGELLGLRWQDVDFDHARVSVRQTVVPVHGRATISDTKTHRSERTVDIDQVTLAELRRHQTRQKEERILLGPGYQDAGLVFAHPDGQMLSPKRVTEWFGRRAASAGVPAIRLHDLRHGVASHMIARGVPVKTVAERLGHSQVSFTMSAYQHVLPGQQAEAAQGFADLIDGRS